MQQRWESPAQEPEILRNAVCHNDPEQLNGTKINHRTEGVDREENPIPGLHAAGNEAGGMYGDSSTP